MKTFSLIIAFLLLFEAIGSFILLFDRDRTSDQMVFLLFTFSMSAFTAVLLIKNAFESKV